MLGDRILPQSAVIRAILLEDSPRCGGAAPEPELAVGRTGDELFVRGVVDEAGVEDVAAVAGPHRPAFRCGGTSRGPDQAQSPIMWRGTSECCASAKSSHPVQSSCGWTRSWPCEVRRASQRGLERPAPVPAARQARLKHWRGMGETSWRSEQHRAGDNSRWQTLPRQRAPRTGGRRSRSRAGCPCGSMPRRSRTRCARGRPPPTAGTARVSL